MAQTLLEATQNEEVKQTDETDNMLLDVIKSSLNEDSSPENAVYNFAKLLDLLPSDLKNFSKYMNIMKQNWVNIADRCTMLREIVGDKEMNELSATLNDYRMLLYTTQSVVTGLLESSDIQKENCEELLDLIESFVRDKYKFDLQQEKEYEDCMKTLGQWIDESDLWKLIKLWMKLITELQKKCDKWKNFKAKAKKGCMALMVGCLAALAFSVAVIVLAIGVNAAAGADISGGTCQGIVEIWGLCIVEGYFVGGCVMGGAAASLAVFAISSGKYNETKLNQEAINIQHSLQNLLKTSQNIEKGLNDLNNISTQKIKKRYDYLKDKKSFAKMKKGLAKIIEYLDEYREHGDKVIDVLDDAFEAMQKLK
eukprot:164653_1